eukprot:3201976-Lingulodinium_polyedra.AAC.1
MTSSQRSSPMVLSSCDPPSVPRWAKAFPTLPAHPPPLTAACCTESCGSMAGPNRWATWEP